MVQTGWESQYLDALQVVVNESALKPASQITDTLSPGLYVFSILDSMFPLEMEGSKHTSNKQIININYDKYLTKHETHENAPIMKHRYPCTSKQTYSPKTTYTSITK